jgi:hypothetical protein
MSERDDEMRWVETNLFRWSCLTVLVVVCLTVLWAMGDPEPALPSCPADRPAHVECKP